MSELTLAEFFKESGLSSVGSIYIAPIDNVTMSKIAKVYPLIENQYIVAIIDNSTFKDFGESCVICSEKVVIKERFKSVKIYDFKDISKILIKDYAIYINDQKAFQFSKKDFDHIMRMFQTLNDYLNSTDKFHIELFQNEHTINEETKDSKVLLLLTSGKNKYYPTILNTIGKVTTTVLNDDEQVNKIAVALYAILPVPVRFMMREEVFIDVILNHRKILLDICGEDSPLEVVDASENPPKLV